MGAGGLPPFGFFFISFLALLLLLSVLQHAIVVAPSQKGNEEEPAPMESVNQRLALPTAL